MSSIDALLCLALAFGAFWAWTGWYDRRCERREVPQRIESRTAPPLPGRHRRASRLGGLLTTPARHVLSSRPVTVLRRHLPGQRGDRWDA